jgi:uncharacterized protein (DUF433 family)
VVQWLHELRKACERIAMSTDAIVNGRIAGTRISVYDVYYYQQCGERPEEIMEILRLRPDQLADAMHFIEEHTAEVHAVHMRIEERNALGNPPEVRAKSIASRAKMLALSEQLKARKADGALGANGEGHPGR